MSVVEHTLDWEKTTFDGVRCEQLRAASRMTIRQRLEAMEQLYLLSRRLQGMKRTAFQSSEAESFSPKQSEA